MTNQPDEQTRQAELDDIGHQLNELRASLDEQADAVRRRLNPFLDQLRDDWKSTRSALGRTASAARDAARDAGDDLADLRADMATVRADFATELSESRDSYRRAVHDLLDVWRARLDRAKVQADLARMDARDEVSADIDRAEHLWSQLKHRLELLGDDSAQAVSDERDEIRKLVDGLRDAVRSAVDRLADALDTEDRAASD